MNENSGNRPRVAIVGCGTQMTTNLMPALQLQDVAVVAACDVNRNTLQQFASRFRLPSIYDSLVNMLDSETLDGVCIAVGPDQHPSLVTETLRYGLPVFVEKPPAWSAMQAKAMQHSSEEMRVPVLVGFNKRFGPNYRALFQMGKLAGVGRPIAMCLRVTCGRYDTDEALLIDFGIHYIDLIRHVLGEIAFVYALRVQVEDGASAFAITFQTLKGSHAQLFLSSLDSWENPSERIFVQWNRYAAEINNLSEIVYRRLARNVGEGWTEEFIKNVNQQWQANMSYPSLATSSIFMSGYLGEVSQFVRIMKTQISLPPTLHDAVAALTLIEAIMQSLETNAPIAVIKREAESTKRA